MNRNNISPVTTGLILIADDDRAMRMLLRLALEQESYEVVEAKNGEECLQLYEQLQPDLILLDAIMPVMDGFTCCKQLKSKITQDKAYTAILMITVLDDPESVDQAFAAGSTDYITKPINWSVLRQRVRRIINQSMQNKQIHLLTQQLQTNNEKLQQLQTSSLVDNVTKLPNYREFEEYLQHQWQITAREKQSLAIILVDIDYFSDYNYVYGYEFGEQCLQQIAKVINDRNTKPNNLVTRYRESVFGVILPETDIEFAVNWGNLIKESVKGWPIINSDDSEPVPQSLTVSCSVVATIPQPDSTPESLLIKVYQGILLAKQLGGDRLIINGELR
jgi:diguanylate cyclase (GGDEF)-like protein